MPEFMAYLYVEWPHNPNVSRSSVQLHGYSVPPEVLRLSQEDDTFPAAMYVLRASTPEWKWGRPNLVCEAHYLFVGFEDPPERGT